MIHERFSECSVIVHNSLARAGADQDRIGSKSLFILIGLGSQSVATPASRTPVQTDRIEHHA